MVLQEGASLNEPGTRGTPPASRRKCYARRDFGPLREERAVRFDRVKVMDRRLFIAVMTSGLLAAPLLSEAQPGRMSRVGVLLVGSAEEFRQRLRELGYVDGQNITIDARDTEGKP